MMIVSTGARLLSDIGHTVELLVQTYMKVVDAVWRLLSSGTPTTDDDVANIKATFNLSPIWTAPTDEEKRQNIHHQLLCHSIAPRFGGPSQRNPTVK